MIKQVRPKLSLLLLTYHRIYINAAVGVRSQFAAESAADMAHHSGSGRVSPSAFFLRRSSASALRFSSRSRFLSPASSNETV